MGQWTTCIKAVVEEQTEDKFSIATVLKPLTSLHVKVRSAVTVVQPRVVKDGAATQTWLSNV